jgi:hypothetical protein
MAKVVAFLKSQAGHKLFGVLLGAGATYLLTGHVDVASVLQALGLN